MSREQDVRPRRMGGNDAPASRPGLIVEDRGCPDQARRFRFAIPSGAAYLTAEEACDLGRWLIWQASARPA